MNRPDDRPASPPADDDRCWQAFALAAGFDDELRDLAAAGEISSPAGDDAIELDAPALLTADRLHSLLELDRSQRRLVEPVRREDSRRERRSSWVAPALLTLASVAVALSAFVWLRSTLTATDEVASAQRLAEEWVAVRNERDGAEEDVAEDVRADVAESDTDPSEESLFEETPDWLVYVVARKAGVADIEAGPAESSEEATP